MADRPPAARTQTDAMRRADRRCGSKLPRHFRSSLARHLPMRPIQKPRNNPSHAAGLSNPPHAPTLLESLTVPVAFALLFAGRPTVFGTPPPWWVIVGALSYGGVAAWGLEVRGRL